MSTTSSIQPWPILRRGDRAHPVQTLQYLLREHGQTISVDGIFGPETDAAVRAFQQHEGLVADGLVGPQTWTAVIVTVWRGSTGEAVRGVQYELFDFRDLSGAPRPGQQIDGIFGPKTEAAVREFQHAIALGDPAVRVDGIVGPVTWRALVSGMLAL
jgi:peptidoglycan hydrolase-like protein with peptidoglycan-binding domain